MKPDEFDDELRALDREFEARGMPADVDARLRARLERPSRRLQWRPLVLGVALASVAAVLWVFVDRPANVGGLVVEQPRDFSAVGDDAAITVKTGTATLRDPTLEARLKVEPGVQLSRLPQGAALRHGRVRFEVARLDGRVASYSVTVSHGVIEVIGTSFIVQQGDDSGSVELLEGTIRFVATDGRTVTLGAGETLRWPLSAVEVAPQPEPTTPSLDPTPVPPRPPSKRVELTPAAPTSEPVKPFSSEAVLARVATLRSRRAYEEAVTALNAAMSEAPNASTRERLGFELGSLLTHQLRDVPRACAFWRAFRVEHPQSRYDEELASTVAALRCENP
jgi:transmembrane sensor